jgi:NDP-sugar pyrophosphorylase family protein
MGKPLIVWTIDALERSGVTEVIVIQSPSLIIEEELRNHASKLTIKFVLQENPGGMGDALLAARDLLQESFVVLHAHQFTADLWLPSLIELKQQSKAEAVLAGKHTEEPWKYGIFKLEGSKATAIVEKPAEGSAPSDVRALGLYLLSKKFIESLENISEEHYSFERALDEYMKQYEVKVHVDDKPTVSLKYPWDLFSASTTLMKLHLTAHQSNSARISPLAHIEGDVFIGENAKIFEYAVIKGPCYVGNDAVVGTHAIVRDFTNLESNVLVGAHAEAARTIFQTQSSTHSGFFGDSIFDRAAKIGAGTITANVKVHRDEIRPTIKGEKTRTARNSLGVVVGSETQLGISVKTMPGILIGANSFVGPGAIVSENIDSNTRYLVKQESILKIKKKRESSS